MDNCDDPIGVEYEVSKHAERFFLALPTLLMLAFLILILVYLF